MIIETERQEDEDIEYGNINELKKIILNFKQSREPSEYEKI
jgi:hypothetical protein